jgi:hypothetical protein
MKENKSKVETRKTKQNKTKFKTSKKKKMQIITNQQSF